MGQGLEDVLGGCGACWGEVIIPPSFGVFFFASLLLGCLGLYFWVGCLVSVTVSWLSINESSLSFHTPSVYT